MTTKFDSKLYAIATGIMYVGREDLYSDGNEGMKPLEDVLKNPEIKVIDGNINQFGHIHEDTLMIEFQSSEDKPCRIATTKFRDGFDLWLIVPEIGISHRV